MGRYIYVRQSILDILKLKNAAFLNYQAELSTSMLGPTHLIKRASHETWEHLTKVKDLRRAQSAKYAVIVN